MPAPALTPRQPEEIDFLKLFLFKRNEVTKQSVFILTIFPLFSAPVFGNSVFDDEEIALDPIGKIEYDYEEEYSDLENEILEEDGVWNAWFARTWNLKHVKGTLVWNKAVW